ncbi:MAG: glycosyltransferase family 4 protein [bacterium]|nr:glycosyltransferase family 4 protein [bacterium]
MNITYFSYLYDIKGISAGSANKALGFTDGLRRLGHRVSVHWLSVQPEDLEGESIRLKIRAGLKKRLSNLLHDPKRLVANLPGAVREFRILRQEKPDVLFLRNELYNFSAATAARLLRVPVVLEVDCPSAFEHRNMVRHNRLVLPVLPEWIERWNWKTCRAIITISDLLKDYLVRSGVPEGKITVVPNGADPDRFRPMPGAQETRRSLGMPGDAVVVGWIGSLYGWSGLENLLAISKRLLRQRRRIVLLFVGGGRNREVIRSHFSDRDLSGRVFLTGTVPYADVPRYLNAMDVVVVPYPKMPFWYPSSMKLFEYMSSQKAVVASAVPQVVDVIRDGRNGFLFDPDDADAFAEKVLRLADSPALRKRLSLAARRTVLESYTWDGHARKMEAVLREAVLSRGKNRADR